MKIFALRCIVNAQGTLVGSLHPYATETIDGSFVNGAIRRVSMTLLVFLPIFARDLCLPPFHVFFQTTIAYRRIGVFSFAHSPTNRFSVWTGRKRTELLANLAVDGLPCFFFISLPLCRLCRCLEHDERTSCELRFISGSTIALSLYYGI